MADVPPGVAPITDRRPTPRGVLPRGVQTWLMAGLAVGILGIIMVTGRPEPPDRQPGGPARQDLAPNPGRLRDYQDRLRLLDERGQMSLDASSAAPAQQPLFYETATDRSVDPLDAEKRRREYESLFAANLVLSRRPERAAPGVNASRPTLGPDPWSDPSMPSPSAPNLDDVAEAVIRATTRAQLPGPAHAAPPPVTPPAPSTLRRDAPPAATDPLPVSGAWHRLLEGTLIETVLTNRLDGAMTAPVNCLVTTAIYSHSGQHVLIPAGARLLGETRPVQAFGEARLAVAFHRLLLPDGRTVGLDHFTGLNQRGDAGLRDRVNQHYWSTFGASAAVGLISGLSQFLGSAGVGRGDGNRTIVIAGGIGEATSQATAQVMNRFLNRLPTITIREGHRVTVYLTSDLELLVYAPRTVGTR